MPFIQKVVHEIEQEYKCKGLIKLDNQEDLETTKFREKERKRKLKLKEQRLKQKQQDQN